MPRVPHIKSTDIPDSLPSGTKEIVDRAYLRWCRRRGFDPHTYGDAGDINPRGPRRPRRQNKEEV